MRVPKRKKCARGNFYAGLRFYNVWKLGYQYIILLSNPISLAFQDSHSSDGIDAFYSCLRLRWLDKIACCLDMSGLMSSASAWTITSSSDIVITDYFYSNSTADLTTAPPPTNMSGLDDIVTRSDECDPALKACQAQRILFLVFGPILLVMSVVGSSLGIAVMARKTLRRTASAVFIACLSVSDMIAVLTGLIRHVELKRTGVSMRLLHLFGDRTICFVLT